MDPLTLIALGIIPILLTRKQRSSRISNINKINQPFPAGKGLFIRSLSKASSKLEFLNDIKNLKLNWIAVQTHWQNDEQKTLLYLTKDHLSWLQEAKNKFPNLNIWFWAFPNTWNIDEFVDLCFEYQKYKLCSGYILDIEKPYLNQGQLATYLIARLRERIKKPIGLTSYGGGDVYIKNFPWIEFSALDFGMPQIYDMKLNLGPNYPEISFKSWLKYFKTNIPIWLAAETHSILDMQDISHRTPVSVGYGWWDYKLIKNRPEIYEYIKTFKRNIINA